MSQAWFRLAAFACRNFAFERSYALYMARNIISDQTGFQFGLFVCVCWQKRAHIHACKQRKHLIVKQKTDIKFMLSAVSAMSNPKQFVRFIFGGRLNWGLLAVFFSSVSFSVYKKWVMWRKCTIARATRHVVRTRNKKKKKWNKKELDCASAAGLWLLWMSYSYTTRTYATVFTDASAVWSSIWGER